MPQNIKHIFGHNVHFLFSNESLLLRQTAEKIKKNLSRTDFFLFAPRKPRGGKKFKKKEAQGSGQHILRCLKNKKCENERTNRLPGFLVTAHHLELFLM